MAVKKSSSALAIQGGPKAVPVIEGKGEPKIAAGEFLSVAKRFGFSAKALKRIGEAINEEAAVRGPFLGHYYADIHPTAVEAYEAKACEVFGVKYAAGVSSGTAALHSAYVAAGVGPGKEVICGAIGFFATPAAVVMAKGVPVFCDVDASLGIDPSKIEALITPRTAAIAVTHVMGSVCDMAAVMKVAKKHKLPVIEDCAQSVGARFKGQRIGTFGDLGCYSISCYKIIGGGEGGLVVTKSKRLWERVSQLVESGGLWRPDRFAPPRYEGELFVGTNYRMSELEAAVDVVQLGRLDTFCSKYRTAKRRIMDRLATYAEITPQLLNDPDGEAGYTLRFYPATHALGAKIVKALCAEGVNASTRGPKAKPDWHVYSDMFPIMQQSGPHGRECVYDCPHYVKQGGKITYTRGDCPVADDLFNRMVNITLNMHYSAGDCKRIAEAITKVLDAYCTRDASAPGWY